MFHRGEWTLLFIAYFMPYKYHLYVWVIFQEEFPPSVTGVEGKLVLCMAGLAVNDCHY